METSEPEIYVSLFKTITITVIHEMPFHWLPDVRRCCYCITNLKTATTVIAVLGIVSEYFLLKCEKYDNRT